MDLVATILSDVSDGLLHSAEDFNKLQAPAKDYVRDSRAVAATAVDIRENSSSYIFVADMPGLSKSDVKVEVEHDKVLSISGKRKREEVDEGTKLIRMERRPSKYLRRFTLPEDANVEGITASCQDGVLSVTVPKIPPEPQKPKVIDVLVS